MLQPPLIAHGRRVWGSWFESLGVVRESCGRWHKMGGGVARARQVWTALRLCLNSYSQYLRLNSNSHHARLSIHIYITRLITNLIPF